MTSRNHPRLQVDGIRSTERIWEVFLRTEQRPVQGEDLTGKLLVPGAWYLVPGTHPRPAKKEGISVFLRVYLVTGESKQTRLRQLRKKLQRCNLFIPSVEETHEIQILVSFPDTTLKHHNKTGGGPCL